MTQIAFVWLFGKCICFFYFVEGKSFFITGSFGALKVCRADKNFFDGVLA